MLKSPFESSLQVVPLGILSLEPVIEQISPGEDCFLLESGLDVAGTGLWDIWGFDPISSFEIAANENSQDLEDRPLKKFDHWFRQWEVEQAPLQLSGETVPFTGGAVGWLSYELLDDFYEMNAREISSTANIAWLDELPRLNFSLHDEIYVRFASTGEAWFLHRNREGWKDRMELRLSSAVVSQPNPETPSMVASSFSESEYLESVREIQKRIGQGDVYEVNLARGFMVAGCPEPKDLHARWRQAQPVPYGALLQSSTHAVVSASPEQFLRRRNKHICTRPIKGTVPRTGDPLKDQRAGAQLLANEKERAELAMIIDLERNDLGRICMPGSVEVTAVADVEAYSTVLHTVATVEGVLQGNPGPGEILEATFPGGSITGAPKRAAMQVIRELEPWPRSVYTGSIGWLSPNGDLEFNIAIRSAIVAAGQALIPFGGAITWDSDPESESREIGHKGRAILGTLGLDTCVDPETNLENLPG